MPRLRRRAPRRRRPRGSATCSRCSRRRGSSRRCSGLKKLKSIADSLPKTVRSGPCQEVVLHRRRGRPRPCCRSRPAGRATRRRSSRCPAVITKDPRTGGAQRRHVPDAEARPALDLHALADPQGRRAMDYLADGRAGSRSRSRSGSTRSPPTRRRAPLPKHIDELMLAGFLRGEPVELVEGEDGRPRGARPTRRDRARGLRRAGTSWRRRARSATTPATTRRRSRSRSSTSRR